MRLASLLLLMTSAGLPALAEKPAGCVNPGLQWTIYATGPDGSSPVSILGDGSDYINGHSGVTSVVFVCSGTFDATLSLSSPRSLSFSFASVLASNSKTPSWALSGSTQSGPGGLNVRNLFFVPAGKNRATDEFEFTTRFGSGVPTTGDPTFPMVNPSPDAPSSVPNLLAIANTPYPTSKVTVRHCPANSNTASCPNITRETWFVYPDATPTAAGVGQNGQPITQVGTLVVFSKGSHVNAGQFRMPFYFRISLLD